MGHARSTPGTPGTPATNRDDVLIVGAGPGGLAAAILLAGAGLKVRVIERLPRIGGRTATLEASGFRFDVGPTFFLYPRILQEIFAAVGADLNREIELIRLDPQYRLIFGDTGRIDATPVIDRMETQIARISPADAAGFRRFLSENREKLRRFRPCLESPFLNWRDLLTPRMIGLLPLLRPWLSLDQELARYFSDPRIRLAFSFQSKYLGMSPFTCPSLFSILSFLEYEHGVFHPVGGCGAITAAMARLATRLGARIELDEQVEEILFNGRRAEGVRTAKGVYRADALVINADFAQAMQKLVPEHLRPRWTNKRISSKRYSCSTFMMYLGIDGRYDIPHHTIYMSNNYRQNLRDIEDLHTLSEDPSVYVQNACVTDDTLAPRGKSTLYILAPVTHQHGNVRWDDEREQFRARVLAQLPKLGITGVEKRILFEKVTTPDDWSAMQIFRGATFSMAHNLTQMLTFRPRNRFEDMDRVYLVGGGTHPGSGLPVIFESARIAARLLMQDLKVKAPAPPARALPPEPALAEVT